MQGLSGSNVNEVMYGYSSKVCTEHKKHKGGYWFLILRLPILYGYIKQK